MEVPYPKSAMAGTLSKGARSLLGQEQIVLEFVEAFAGLVEEQTFVDRAFGFLDLGREIHERDLVIDRDTGSGGDQLPDDQVLLEALEVVDLRLDRSLGENVEWVPARTANPRRVPGWDVFEGENDAAEMKLSVVNDALVIPWIIGYPVGGALPALFIS